MPIRSHNAAELRRNFVGQLLRSLARRLRRALNLLPVLVGAGEKVSVNAQHALPPRHGVAGNGGVRVADMRPRIDVVDRRRDVELLAHCTC